MTGILLLFYYRPTTAEAYESVQFIMTKVEFGWLIRSVHSWSANLMILAAFIHMFSVVFLHAYRKPRELTWLSGIALLGLALAFGFSGYLLPWNKVSYFATKVGTGGSHFILADLSHLRERLGSSARFLIASTGPISSSTTWAAPPLRAAASLP